VPRNIGRVANGPAVDRAERVKKALELRKAGVTFEKIAEQCGYNSLQTAYKAITKAIRDIPREVAADVRSLELERLDRLTLAVWSSAAKGDQKSIETVLKLMKRRASLLGLDLDAPLGDARPALTGLPGQPPEAVQGKAYEELLAWRAQQRSKILARPAEPPGEEPTPPQKAG
jgi:hypothetical protein